MEILEPREIIREAEKIISEIKQVREASLVRIAQHNDEQAKFGLKECDKQIDQLEQIISRARKLEANTRRSQGFLSGQQQDRIFRQLGGKQ